MKNKSIIYQISLTGILTSLGIVIGMFAYFPLGAGNVYLVGVILFLMPLVLKFQFALIGCLLSLLFTDLYTGYIATTWISLIAYSIGLLIIYWFRLLDKKWLFIVGLILGSLVVSIIYLILEFIVFDRAYAIADFWATLLQFTIIVPITSILYTPILIISKNN
ncbi:MAG: hypothetical protein HRT99_02415 [Mycoplasmatales bacterium]|nr:hypothetical protein [Mycoplasmatales bacterium]